MLRIKTQRKPKLNNILKQTKHIYKHKIKRKVKKSKEPKLGTLPQH